MLCNHNARIHCLGRRFLEHVLFIAFFFPWFGGCINAAPGDRDGGFATTLGGASPSIYATALQMDGKIVIGGLFSTVGGQARNNLARVDGDGALDASFDSGADSYVRCLAVQSDGKVLLGGDFATVAGVPRSGLARLNADGTLDTGFNPSPNGAVMCIAVQSDGRILIGGFFTNVSGAARPYLARLVSSGANDTSFNPGTSANGSVQHINLQTDGKVIIGGGFTTFAGVARTGIARLTTTGALDAGFLPPSLGGTSAAVACTVAQTDGKVMIGGNFATADGVAHAGLARLNADGSLDSGMSLNLGTNGGTPAAWSMALQADGKLIVAGTFETVGGVARMGLARLDAAGAVDPGFFHSDIAPASEVGLRAAVLLADGKVLIGGPHLVGSSPSYLSRLHNDPATQNLTAPTSSQVQWLRGGSTPETQQVSFDLSTNGGSTWPSLGNGVRIAGGWQITGVSIPGGALLRGRARVSGGTCNGSSGQISSATSASIPVVTTGTAVEVLATTALVEGVINPNGFATTAVVQFGTTTGYGSSAAITLSPPDGTTPQSVSAVLTGLQPNTYYHYRISATSTAGSAVGQDRTFFSSGPAPAVVTGAATAVTTSTATLNGTVNPNSNWTHAVFQYGLTTAYGSVLPLTTLSFGGTTPEAVTAALTGLQPNATYHYRLIASNDGGIVAGADLTFTTAASGLPLIVIEQPAGTALTSGTATVDFGTSLIGVRISKTFTVRNLGAADMTLGALTFSGPNAGEFYVIEGPIATVLGPGASTTCRIAFDPDASGARASALHVASSDAARSPYSINLAGTGTAGSPTGGLQVIINPESAVAAGARWSAEDRFLNASGSVEDDLAPGPRLVTFNPVPGLAGPPWQTPSVIAGQTVSVNASYTALSDIYQWTNFAGTPGGAGSIDGAGGAARFDGPHGVALDGEGNVWVADSWNNAIRRITPAGVVATMVSGPELGFMQPQDLEFDGSGNLFVSGSDNTVRKITPGLVVTLVAGAHNQSGMVDGIGTAARFSDPGGIGADLAGNVFVADRANHTIRKITPAGVVTTVAGIPSLPGSTNGGGGVWGFDQALFSGPTDVAVDSAGNLYVADGDNNVLRKIEPNGTVTTVAGLAGSFGSSDGTGSSARFGAPKSLCIAENGDLLVTDAYGLRKVTTSGLVTTRASGPADFDYIAGVATDGDGNAYIADIFNYVIHKVTPAGAISVLAGMKPSTGLVNAEGGAARFDHPNDAATDSSGNIYVADARNNAVRKISPAGVVTTLAGGSFGSADGQGASAQFNSPEGLCLDAGGNVYVADTLNNTIRKITPGGLVSTIAGLPGVRGSTDGTGNAARFNYPRGVSADASGNVYVADTSNCTIRKVDPFGTVTTLAGSPGLPGDADGTGGGARFSYPEALAVDGSANIWAVDTNGLRQVTSAGVVKTILNSGQIGFSLSAISIDAGGNLFLADDYTNTIHRLAVDGSISRIGGASEIGGSADGVGTSALFSEPSGIAVSPSGVVYVVDTGNNRVSRGMATSQPDIIVEQPSGFVLADGQGQVDYGTVMTGADVMRVFTIRNGGKATLDSLAITKDGPNAAEFTVGALGSATLPPGTETSFAVTFRAGALGPRSAAIHITSNAPFKNPFHIGLAGVGTDVDGSGPSGGTMIVFPGSPFLPSETLTVSFAGWTDASPPLSYEVLVDDVVASLQGASTSRNITGPASTGPHVLKGRVRDALGNVSEVEQTFSVRTRIESWLQFRWRQLHFGGRSNVGDAADLFDFDKDGLVNLLEYAFGLDPRSGTSSQLPQGQVSGGNFIVTFVTPGGVGGVTYGAEWSAALSGNPADWTAILDTGTGSNHTFSVPLGTHQRLFVRLKVSVP